MKNNYWPSPEKRSVGLFTDLKLFVDTLELADLRGPLTKLMLTEELTQRVKGLIFIENLSKRVIDDLIRELIAFGWIDKSSNKFQLSEEGISALSLSKKNKFEFLKLLVVKMQKIYSVPAWFVNRLWDLNEKRQGEIVIPAPVTTWNPKSRDWKDNAWTNDLEYQTKYSFWQVNQVIPGSFPVLDESWVSEVKKSWERLSNIPPRIVARISRSKRKDGKEEKEKMKTFTPRRRLANAMQEAAIRILFNNINPLTKTRDFKDEKSPLSPRIYMAWCPRLSELGLIFYSDFHPQISGRIIFPVSVFKTSNESSSFIPIKEIISPKREYLYLHRPKLGQSDFNELLLAEHHKAFLRSRSLYVSIMDVRDEVCRQLRISADTFDNLLADTIYNTYQNNFTISLESDVREDQTSGYQRLRRPVVIRGKLYSLIAIAK